MTDSGRDQPRGVEGDGQHLGERRRALLVLLQRRPRLAQHLQEALPRVAAVEGRPAGEHRGFDLLGHALVLAIDLAEQRVGDRRRTPHRQPRVHRRRLAAVVVDLGEDRHAVAVDGMALPPAVAGARLC